MRVKKPEHKHGFWTRVIALACAVFLCANLLPVSTWAAEGDDTDDAGSSDVGGTGENTDENTDENTGENDDENTEPPAQTVSVSFTVEHADVTGETTTEKGKDYSFTVEANTGYEVTKVTYQVENGKTKTATSVNGKYTVPGKDVTGDLKIQITVEAISYTITYFDPFGNKATDSYIYA